MIHDLHWNDSMINFCKSLVWCWFANSLMYIVILVVSIRIRYKIHCTDGMMNHDISGFILKYNYSLNFPTHFSGSEKQLMKFGSIWFLAPPTTTSACSAPSRTRACLRVGSTLLLGSGRVPGTKRTQANTWGGFLKTRWNRITNL